MATSVQGRLDRGVTESLLDDLWVFRGVGGGRQVIIRTTPDGASAGLLGQTPPGS
jgi:hypothetical protein